LVKFAGAAYLIFLGIRTIQTRNAADAPDAGSPESCRNAFRQGIVTEVLNPKTALFFLSFIPQFVQPAAGRITAQFLVLGFLSVVFNTSADLAVVSFAGPLARVLQRSVRLRRRQRVASGAVMVGLGAYVALDSH
jgi:threonine/homoserine/homoserine lactone efflux protein